MNADALTHEALVAADGTKLMDDAVSAVKAEDTFPVMFEEVTYEAVWAVVMVTDALTHDALAAADGTKEIALARDAVRA